MSTESHPNSRIVRIVCTSDTHNDVPPHGSIPNGDIFVHAGDMTDYGSYDELKTAFDWISALPHPVKIIIAGKSKCLTLVSCFLLMISDVLTLPVLAV